MNKNAEIASFVDELRANAAAPSTEGLILVAYRVRCGGKQNPWWVYFNGKERAEWFAGLRGSAVEPLYAMPLDASFEPTESYEPDEGTE